MPAQIEGYYDDLPIFAPDTEVIKRGHGKGGRHHIDIALETNPDRSHVVRSIGIDIWSLIHSNTESPLNLHNILEITDSELELAAECVGNEAQVVEHTWGLWCPNPNTKVMSYLDCYPPENIPSPSKHILVASVAVVPDSWPVYDTRDTELYRKISEGMAAYRNLPGERYYLKDMWPHQAVINSADEITIVDIEPRLGRLVAEQVAA